MHRKVICILGKSGSGKDTLFKEVLRLNDNFTPLIPFTTRPPRKAEIEGFQYHFVSEDEMLEMEKDGKIIERRTYHTIYGPWYYFTVDVQEDSSRPLLLISTPKALTAIADYYGKDNVVVIFLKADDKIRLLRSIEREDKVSGANYSEICRRFLADEEDFANIDFNSIKNYTINANDSIENCIKKFEHILKEI